MDYIVLDTVEGIRTACEYFAEKEVLGLDVETTALEPWDGDLRLIQVSDGEKTIIVDVRNLKKNEKSTDLSFLLEDLRILLENPQIAIVIHNSKFEQKWLISKCNISPNRVFDTFLASQNIDFNTENLPEKAHNLGAVGRRFLQIDLDKAEQKSDWGRETLTKEQLDYAALDVYYLPALRKVMYAILESEKLLNAALIDFEVVPVTAKMELKGHHVVRKRYVEEIKVLEELRDTASGNLQSKLRPTTGIDWVQPSFFSLPERNYGDVLLTSHSQVLEALQKLGLPVFAKSDAKNIEKFERERKLFAVGTGSKNLAPLTSTYPVIKLLQDFRGLEKQVTAYGESFLAHLRTDDYGDERVHATYLIIGAPTGRFACRNPNLQQMPAGKVTVGDLEHIIKFREAFQAPKGRKLVNADYSQIELRIAAEFSNDPVFIDAFLTGKDLHALTASICFNVPYEDCLEGGEHYKTHRAFAKRINFGIVYGIGAWGLSTQLLIPIEEAEDIIQKHKDSHPVLWKFLFSQANKAVKSLKARTASGRMQRFTAPSIGLDGFPDKREVGEISRNGKNMPIQGCLAFDSRVLVQSLGYCKIGDAAKGKSEVWDGNNFVNGIVAESGLKKLCQVKFSNGNVIECSPEHKFEVNTKEGNIWTEAQFLKKGSHINRTGSVPAFDFLNLKDCKYLSKISSHSVGLLAGIVLNYKRKNKVKIPVHQWNLKTSFEGFLVRAGVEFSKEEVDMSTQVALSYTLPEEFYTELETLVTLKGFKENAWKSKRFIEGFLKSIFAKSKLDNNSLSLRASKVFLQDVQQALFLCGIDSRITSGLVKDYLSLDKLNLYNFIIEIGSAFDEYKFDTFMKQKVCLSYSVMRSRPLTSKVLSVRILNKEVEMFDVVDSDTFKFMSNGVITHNTSADILKRALKLLDDSLEGLDADIVNIVHDEITVECKESIAEEVKVKLAKAMKDAGEEYITKIPVVVDAKIVKSWSDK